MPIILMTRRFTRQVDKLDGTLRSRVLAFMAKIQTGRPGLNIESLKNAADSRVRTVADGAKIHYKFRAAINNHLDAVVTVHAESVGAGSCDMQGAGKNEHKIRLLSMILLIRG